MAQRTALLAKLSRPRLYDALPRERLFTLLDAKRRHPVVWIVAPPGSGKTTLVASYLESRKIPAIWYQADIGDGDPATLFYYLGLAANAFGNARRLKKRPLPLLTPEYLPDLPGFSRRYFQTLFGRLGTPAALVFDNYQEVSEGSSFHEIVQRSVSSIPDGLNLILISRAEPPGVFSSELATRSIAQLGWEDLRLTFEEASGIIQARFTLSPADLKSLYAQSDGWLAGLVLMLERSPAKARSPIRSSESVETIFDYFASQVFDQTTPAVYSTLLATSLFGTVTAALAIEISGNADAGKLLESFYRRHLFTDRSTGPVPSYQYHALFREFLLRKLHESQAPADLRALKVRAAELLLQRDEPEDALKLCVECGEWQRVVSIILRTAPTLIAQGRRQTLEEWLGLVPPNVFSFQRVAPILAWLRPYAGRSDWSTRKPHTCI